MSHRPIRSTRHAGGGIRAAVTLLLTLVTMASVMLAAAPAQAAPAQTVPATSMKPTQIIVPMKVKPSGDVATNAAPVPCGSLYINIVPEGLGGQVRLEYGFSVTLGTVTYRNIKVIYANFGNGLTGQFTDNSLMFSQVYDTSTVVFTGLPLGTIDAAIGVSVVLVDLTICVGVAENVLPFP